MEKNSTSIPGLENLHPLSPPPPRGSTSTPGLGLGLENPSPMSRSPSRGSPTTFIEAGAETFKKVVQMLTGDTKQGPKPAGPGRTGPRRAGFKLQERRSSLKNLKIIPGLVLDSRLSSPSVLGLHRLVLSPAKSSESPKTGDCVLSFEEKGFYLPLATPRGSEPRLLPLFPTTSPRVSGAS